MRYVNCGHCPPFLLRASGEITKLEPTASMLGAFEEWDCGEDEVSLNPGDTLLLYSDGVTEALNTAGDDFGEDRLVRTLRESGAPTARDLTREIVDAVSLFSGAARMDDITVVAIRGV
jgi:sigma-B regulation protein RsbU (phosphoserine phosphatase)